MTQKEIEKMQARLEVLYREIDGASMLDIVQEIVELETTLEAESNK